MKLYSCIVNHFSVLFNTGNGKTYHIRKCLEKFPEDHKLIVSVNESFKVSTILQRMRSLNRDGEPCGLFFNFTFFLVCTGLILH